MMELRYHLKTDRRGVSENTEGEAACVGGRAPHINPPFFSACLSSCAAAVNCIGNKGGKSVRTCGREAVTRGERALTELAPISLRKLPAERRGSGPANGACVPLASAPCLLLASASRIHLMGYRLEGVIHRGSAITHTQTHKLGLKSARTRSSAASQIMKKAGCNQITLLFICKILSEFLFKFGLLGKHLPRGPGPLGALKA